MTPHRRMMYSLAFCSFNILLRPTPFFNILVRPQPFFPWLMAFFILDVKSGVFLSRNGQAFVEPVYSFAILNGKVFLLDWHAFFVLASGALI